MLSVKKINISDEGKKVTFDYELSKEIKKYFSSQKFFVEYDVVIASVPENILVIPFLANVLPISWFAGFDVYVNELDKEFLDLDLNQFLKEGGVVYDVKGILENVDSRL